MLGQTDEYRALERARDRLNSDREAVAAMNRLADLETRVAAVLERGEQPPEAERDEYEAAFGALQASAVYQGYVAAQSNFDKVVARVNEQILAGIESGARSRIILPS
jgi:cell fate (sporulation/competence/biofilm development) regulator YlbF (YheA/YmcA/DUF963 family)